jgi:hypothetical protein
MNQEEQAKVLNQLIAKCWADETFKQSLLADPVAILKAQGVELPSAQSVKVVENTDQVTHLVIPAKPTDLSDVELDKVSAGLCSLCGGHRSPFRSYCMIGI